MRQVGDHLVHIGEHGRLIDLGVGRVVAHSRNVGLDRAGEELHVLRQVADVLAELALVPVAQVHQVQPHVAGRREDRADKHLAERGLAGARIANDGQRVAWR
jgi:hypothetical protein